MIRRHLGLARATAALGVLSVVFSLTGLVRGDDRINPLPGQPSGGPGEAVSVLSARQQGLLDLSARGNGEDRVHLTLRNVSPRPLKVVLPAGLVAAAGAGQFGGFQSMGLGTPTESPGAFGQFAAENAGFRSMPVDGMASGLAIAPGQTLEVDVPAVCLNFGLPTPTPRNEFNLVDVEDYTPDVRAQRALRTVATLGTSQKVAQAVAWNTFNGMSFDAMAVRAAKQLNVHELALASRFVSSLDESAGAEIVDPAYLQHRRIFVRVKAQGDGAGDVAALTAALAEGRLLGLPVQVVEELPAAADVTSAVFVDVSISAATPSLKRGQVALQYRAPRGGWASLGKAEFESRSEDGADTGLAPALDQAIARTFVRVRTVKKAAGFTTLAIENRLPLTISAATLRTGPDSAGELTILGLGLGPARSTQLSVPTAGARLERIEFNGL